ncbi:PAS domain-containing protein [Roseisalinus antarcticus]|nr:PAS domain-containing protein [Roseisalinus antarcticus]
MTDQTTLIPGEDRPAHIPALRQMERYWNELRGGHRLPQRRDVDPARLEDSLPHAFLMQRVAPNVGRLRVAGQQLTKVLGMDPRGMPLTAFFGVEARKVLSEQLRAVFDGPTIVEIPVASRRGLGRPRLSGRLLLLPLIGDDGMVSACLGALMVDGTIGSAPRRFDIAPGVIRAERVRSPSSADLRETLLAQIEETGREGAEAPRPAPALSGAPRVRPERPARAPAVERRRPYLRLVVDNG